MTAIIIVVVVALVFFVSICVVTFMVWKHETEMRTDSLRAIEKRLEVLGSKLAESGSTSDKAEAEELRENISRIAQTTESQYVFRKRGADPFSWMRSNKDEHPVIEEKQREVENTFEPETIEEYEVGEREIFTEKAEMSDYEIHDRRLEEDVSRDIHKPYSSEDYKERERIYAEIDLDFAEIRNIVSEMKKTEEEQLPESLYEENTEPAPVEITLPEMELEDNDFNEVMKTPMQYDVGRSGRKYTATELETLIKE